MSEFPSHNIYERRGKPTLLDAKGTRLYVGFEDGSTAVLFSERDKLMFREVLKKEGLL